MALPGPGAVSPYARPKPDEIGAVITADLAKTWHIVRWTSGAWTAFRNPIEARMIADAARVRVQHSDVLP